MSAEDLHSVPTAAQLVEAVREYLTTSIYYYLDGPCLDGLRLFYQYAYACGALPKVPELRFAEPKPALT